jgi:hypothetical protein
MPFHVDEIIVLDIGHTRFPDGTKIETSTSISRVLVVESFPATLNWRLAIKFTCDVRCTVACDARVLDPSGRPLPEGHLKFVAERGSDREELRLPVFTVPAKGTYAVRLFVNGSQTPAASQDVMVDVAASIA